MAFLVANEFYPFVFIRVCVCVCVRTLLKLSRISPGKDDLDNERKDDRQKSGSEGGVTEIIQNAADSKVGCAAATVGPHESKEKLGCRIPQNPYRYTHLQCTVGSFLTSWRRFLTFLKAIRF